MKTMFNKRRISVEKIGVIEKVLWREGENTCYKIHLILSSGEKYILETFQPNCNFDDFHSGQIEQMKDWKVTLRTNWSDIEWYPRVDGEVVRGVLKDTKGNVATILS